MEGGRILLPIFSRLLGKTPSEFLMRTVISVIDLQSDLERERSRCARKGDPDKAGLLGIVWLRVALRTADPDWGCPSVLERYRRPLRRSGLRHMSPQPRHRITSSPVAASSVAIGSGVPHDGAHRVPRRCGRPTARGLVGHEILLDDDAEGVRTFFGFER